LRELFARETNSRLRARIIEAIAEIPSPKACEVLIAVSDTNRVIVMACIDALRKVCSSSSVQAEAREQAYQKLISCLRWNDLAVSTTAASALADSTLLCESSVQPLMQAYARLKTPDDVEPMVEILRTLGAIKSPKAVPMVKQALSDKDKTVVTAAAEALRSITGEDLSHRILQHSVTVHTDYDWKYFDALKKHRVIRIQTNKGSIKIRLFPEDAPFTVMSMLKLIDRKFFNGLTFHRVVPNFVIQGGDPRGDGWGGPGYAVRSEFSLLKYKRGMVGVASAGKDTEGCQVFITHCSTPHLDGRYTIFGEVIEGMEVVDKIQIGDDIVSVEVVADSR
jgi:cyclophilin family peptidyl-prolyl cis-trans isomerase